MTTKQFNKLFLNIYDELEIVIKDFYYKITEEANRKKLDYGYDKQNEEGWIACPTLKGLYCGFRNHQSGELHVIKVHVTSFPYPMAGRRGNYDYIELGPLAIQSITITKKEKPSGMDKIGHKITRALADKKNKKRSKEIV